MIGKITIEDNSADSIKDNIKAVGEMISGKIVNLVASNDVFLQAAMNTSEKLENAKSKGWSVGANISVTGGGILDFEASANAVKEKGNMSSSNGKMKSNYISIIDQAAISNGTIEVRDSDFNIQTLSRDTKESLNKVDEIFDKKKIEERQELSKLFAKEAFGQLHNWNPTSKEGKTAKAIAHGVVAEVSARMAGNKPGSGFYAGATNEALIGEIQKIAKEKPDVAQTLSALLGAAVNGSLGHSPVTGAAEAQYGTKWNLELDYHAATVRQSAYEEMKRHYNSNYLRREILSYSPDEISEAKDNLERRLANAESSGAFAGSVELLGFFLDQSPSKHGIIDVDYTSNGYPIYIFGENSAFTQALKNDYELNRRLVRLAIKNRDNSGVDMPTDFDSTQFYTNSFDTAVGLGEATYIVTYKKDYINRRVEAKITITDDYDFSKEDARFDIYKSAYILQASRERRPYAYKATYDMEFPLSDVTEVHRWEG